MKKFAQYNDAMLVIGVLGLFVLGGFLAYQQWNPKSDEWETDFSQSLIDMSDISSMGLGRDKVIMPIDYPRFVDVASASAWLDGRTPVIALIGNHEARAYPLTILLLHEIVNDDFEGIAVAVTYCPLCNSPIVYKREVDGHILRMGVTGHLYNNNFLMYDDLTESWWHQFSGQAIVGEYTGRFLDIVPSQVVAFSNFARHYPRGEVLAGDEFSPNQNYAMNPYIDYERSSSPMLNRGDYDPRLPAMERVLGVNVQGISIAYPFSDLRQIGIVNDHLSDRPIVVFWQSGAASPLDALTIRHSRDMGQAAIFGRFVDGRELSFYIERGRIMDRETESEWNIFGVAVSGSLEGEALESFNAVPQFWFSWASAYPNTDIFEAENGE